MMIVELSYTNDPILMQFLHKSLVLFSSFCHAQTGEIFFSRELALLKHVLDMVSGAQSKKKWTLTCQSSFGQ